MPEITTSPTKEMHKKAQVVAFTAIVAIQILVLAIAAIQKTDFHIDEIYSYVISNNTYADRFSHVSWLQDQWVTGSDFDKNTTVQDGHQLDFAAAYNNTATDCHPPLYYWLLHAVCALFPGVFTKWTGIGLNIALFVLCQILILLISRKLFVNDWLSLCPSLLYGFSALCIGNVEYIRMYVLLTALALFYIYLSLRIIEVGIKPILLALCCTTVFLGALTQYYFLFFVFWMALLFGFWLIIRKRTREALAYGFGHIIAVLGMMVVFPYAIGQATGSETNNVGNEVSQSMLDFGLWRHQIGYLIKETIGNISYARKIGYIALIIATVISVISLIVLLRHKQSREISPKSNNIIIANRATILAWLAATFVLTFLTVAKVGGNYVYVRYIYFITPIVFICFSALVDMGSSRVAALVPIALAGAVLFGLTSGIYTAFEGDSSYTFDDSASIIAEASQYKEIPLVVLLANSPTTVLTSNYTLIRSFNNVYVGSAQSTLDGDAIQSALFNNGRCIVYIPTASDWTDGLNVEDTISQIQLATNSKEPQYLFDGYYGTYFLISR